MANNYYSLSIIIFRGGTFSHLSLDEPCVAECWYSLIPASLVPRLIRHLTLLQVATYLSVN